MYFLHCKEKDKALENRQFFYDYIYAIFNASGVIQNIPGIQQSRNFGVNPATGI